MAARFLFIFCSYFLKLNATKRKIKFILCEYTSTTLLHMYHSHAFVPWTFCLQSRVYCTESVKVSLRKKKTVLCCRHYRCTSLLVGFNNQHFSIVSTGVRGQFRVGERMGIPIVLSHSHCTKRITSPLDNSLSSFSLCVFTGGTFVCVWHSCCQSVVFRVRRENDGSLLESLLLRPDQRRVCDGESGGVGQCVGASRLPLKRLAVHSSPTVGTAVALNQMQSYLTALPDLCFQADVLHRKGRISAGSVSHGTFSLIKFCSSILPYLQLHQTVPRALA